VLAGVLRVLAYAAERNGDDSGGDLHVGADWPWFADLAPGAITLCAGEAELVRGLAAEGAARSADWLGDIYQELLTLGRGAGNVHARRRRGAFYTPAAVAARLAEETLGPLLDAAEAAGGAEAILALRVCDPACGSGRFLLAAVDLIARRAGGKSARRAAAACVYGIDLDSVAAELCRYSLWRIAGRRVSSIAHADALLGPFTASWPPRFDAVLGNPPFLNQLETGTARTREARAALAAQFPGLVRPYTDTSALFLVRALEMVRPGGRIGLIQPQSLLASRDAEPVRRRILERASLDGLWTAGPGVFAAGVHVCAPILTVDARPGREIDRWHGPELAALPAVPAEDASPESWAPLMAESAGLPRVTLRTSGTLADIASATADFRDQFYGLRGCIVEDVGLGAAERRRFPLLVTSGLIDPAICRWGERPCRLLGRAWQAPRADPDALGRAGLGPWSRARLVPKLLLATQTRTLEAVVDEPGALLPVTPIITIVPRDPGRLWHIAAAVLSPPLTAWAVRRFAGTGLTAGAIKLSARQVLELPLPAACEPWDRAAEILKILHKRPVVHARGSDGLHEAGALMCQAYGLDDASQAALLTWWRSRLERTRRPAPPVTYNSPL
jgi:SAM-dependent methyltransferase